MKCITIQDLFDRTWAEHWNTARYLRSGWATEAKRLHEKLIAPTLGSASLKAITAARVRSWHAGLAATPLQANRALGVLSKMLSFAEEKEWRPQGTNVCGLVKPYPEKKRKRFASPEEIKKLGEILDREAATNPRAVAFIYVLLLSGARPRSIERATWGDVDIINHDGESYGILTFFGKGTADSGESETVIIPPKAMKLLENCKNEDSLTGIKMPKDFWDRIRKEAGCADLWARDLRRTFATVGLSNDVGLGVIGELLNHKSTNTTKIYAKLMNKKRIEATKQIADQMSLILKGKVS